MCARQERKKMNKIETFMFGFSTLLVKFMEQQKDVVCKLFALLCFVSLGAAPIPYVQAAILNLPYPY